MKEIYFDNSATTRPTEKAVEAMNEAMTLHWGNPSSGHERGIDADRILSHARETVIRSLGITNPKSGVLTFTASGTESDNLAITGTLFSKKFRYKPRIITTDSEHPAVLLPIAAAAERGFEVIRLSTRGGKLDMDELNRALTPETVLISLMRVNNETGAVYEIADAFAMAKEKCPDIVTHCDAVQGYMKLPCSPKKLGCDLLSISGHKIGGPKGIGALFCDAALLTKKRLTPIIFGGGQEGGLRSGTENIIGIAGFEAAVQERYSNIKTDGETVKAIRDHLINHLPDTVEVNQPEGEYLSHIISIRVPRIKSEVLVRFFSSAGICLSAGSACSTKKLKTSPTLLAFGLTPKEADSTVRISLSPFNTVDEVDRFIEVLNDAMVKLQTVR